MAGREPEEQVPVPITLQRWRDMTFLHWSYDPDVLAGLLPPGLEPDVHDGRAWVGMTPFVMDAIRPPVGPAVPGLSTFPETNVRTYVRGPGGVDGLWFLTLEADNLALVLGARAFYGVPYRWAAMKVDRDGDRVVYRSRRRSSPTAGHHVVVRPLPGDGWEPGPLDHWLTGRWRAWTSLAGRLASVAVRHSPWPLGRAEVLDLDEDLVVASGLPAPDGPPLVHFSPGVDDVRLGRPRFS